MQPTEDVFADDPRLHGGFVAAPIPTVLLSRVGLIVAANEAFNAFTARIASASSSILGLAHPRDRARLAKVLDVVGQHPVDALPVLFGGDEASVAGEVYATTVDADLVCVQIVDLSRRRERSLELERLALYDDLTGLLNRRGFAVEADHLLALGARSRRHVSLLFADVVGLKAINDRAGHQAGDEILRRAAVLLRTAFRDGDVIGRLGGDEFAVVALTSGQKSATALHRRFIELVRADNDPRESGHRLEITVGVVSRPAWDAPTIDTLLAAGDRAMYRTRAEQRP